MVPEPELVIIEDMDVVLVTLIFLNIFFSILAEAAAAIAIPLKVPLVDIKFPLAPLSDPPI